MIKQNDETIKSVLTDLHRIVDTNTTMLDTLSELIFDLVLEHKHQQVFYHMLAKYKSNTQNQLSKVKATIARLS